ncbi:DUF4956 domain-containing protein [Candidatus Pelagibacter sp.]|nr:DUF4956 domain-containing protein [Candidatus Pelagibacter sp.]
MEEIKPFILLVISALLIRQTLIFSNQGWAKSYSQTISFLLLPIITYVITKTIAGNIALSLGMIGALSIVRFRHPVKSALELIIYFDLITLGIATSVNTKWANQLLLFTILIILFVKLIGYLLKKIGKTFYNISFNEGIEHNTMEVYASEHVQVLENSENLKNMINDKENDEFIYRLTFEKKEHLLKFKEEIANKKLIKKIEVQFI